MLVSELQKVLPKVAEPFQLHHVRTAPRKCRRLIYVGKKADKSTPLDTQAVHFFVLSYRNISLYVLEIYVFESLKNVTVFISKADTSGHYYEDQQYAVSYRELTTVLIKAVLREYVNTAKPVRVCLFAKSAARYLFPASETSTRKHVLKDTGLVKWWVRVLDPVLSEFSHISKAKLQIPGTDTKSIDACFPKDGENKSKWSSGDIFSEGVDLSAVKCIPRFPDDPKSRFLDYLVSEKRALKTSASQFWLELPSRQEFRLGSVVGIIGVEGLLKPYEVDTEDLTPLTSHKDWLNIYECIMSLDFSSKEKAEKSTQTLLDLFPESICHEIMGSRRPLTERKRTAEDTSSVNTLSAGLIRKKPKKA